MRRQIRGESQMRKACPVLGSSPAESSAWLKVTTDLADRLGAAQPSASSKSYAVTASPCLYWMAGLRRA